MKSLVESINEGKNESLVRKIADIFFEVPDKNNLADLNNYWKELDLEIKGATWKIHSPEYKPTFWYTDGSKVYIEVSHRSNQLIVGKGTGKKMIDKIKDTLSLRLFKESPDYIRYII